MQQQKREVGAAGRVAQLGVELSEERLAVVRRLTRGEPGVRLRVRLRARLRVRIRLGLRLGLGLRVGAQAQAQARTRARAQAQAQEQARPQGRVSGLGLVRASAHPKRRQKRT